MYRAVIEHPEWIPADVQKKIDLRAGSQEGRIYRVYPVELKPRLIPRLDKLDTAGLVGALDSPSGWQRDTAQRLLMHKNDRSAIEPLRNLASTTRRPQARIQAIWTLSLLSGLDEATAVSALTDPHPQVRRNAVKASEAMLKDSPRLAEAALALAADPDPRVRLQVALTLGNWNDPRAGKALARIIRREPGDSWIRAGVISSAVPHVATMLAELLKGPAEPPPQAVIEPLVVIAGSIEDRSASESVIRAISTPAGQGGAYASWQFAAARGLFEASRRSRRPIEKSREKNLLKLHAAARRLVEDGSATLPQRTGAVNLLGFMAASKSEDRDLLVGLLKPRVAIEVQQAAISALARSADPKVPELLLRGWKAYSPQVRSDVLDAVQSRKAWTGILLSSLEETCVPPAEVDPPHRALLLAQRDPGLRHRAEAVFAHQGTTRQKVIEAFKPALALKGNPAAGKAVFTRVCSTCHKLGDVGVEVGPNLGAVKDKSPEALLIAILDPNRAFESRYANFTVATTDGRVLNGMIASETASAVTLRRQEGKEEVLLRSEIEEISASGQSLMAEGLEKDLSQRDLTDLIAFLEGATSSHKP
jgi:putative heme-binding domain-containing protein